MNGLIEIELPIGVLKFELIESQEVQSSSKITPISELIHSEESMFSAGCVAVDISLASANKIEVMKIDFILESDLITKIPSVVWSEHEVGICWISRLAELKVFTNQEFLQQNFPNEIDWEERWRFDSSCIQIDFENMKIPEKLNLRFAVGWVLRDEILADMVEVSQWEFYDGSNFFDQWFEQALNYERYN